MPDTEAGKRHRTLFLERSDVSCRTCGKPHDHRWTGYRSTLSTWADPVDGHALFRMNAAEAVAAERARIRAAVEGLFDSPAVYPGSMAATIRAENDLVRAVLRIIEGGDANA